MLRFPTDVGGRGGRGRNGRDKDRDQKPLTKEALDADLDEVLWKKATLASVVFGRLIHWSKRT